MVFGQRWIFALLLLCVAPVRAELQIEINQGVENPTPIAVVPFAWQGVGLAPEDVAQIVDSDLARSGQFAPSSASFLFWGGASVWKSGDQNSLIH